MNTPAEAQRSRYSLDIRWSDIDDAYIVSFPEWEAAGHLAHTHGATYVEAAEKGADLLAFLIESAREDGDAAPAPRLFDEEYTDEERAEWGGASASA